ncbi:MAG: hypothetical protein ACTSUZ_05355 [Candidatus Thorarchaeota archaeon]
MNRTTKSKLVVASVCTLILFLAASSTFAEPDYTTECGDCHTVSPSYTMASNSTGNATIGVTFTLRINATKPMTGGVNFWLTVQAGWGDNDQFNFTPASIQDNSGGDLTMSNWLVTHDFTFTPLSVGNYTIKAWCSTSAASQYLEMPIDVVDIPDETPPIVDSPSDIAYDVTTTGHSILWTPTDDHPSEFNVKMNGSVILSGGWDGDPIIIDVDYLGPGTYEYNLTVIDVGGNSVSDVVIVTVSGELLTTTTTTDTTSETSTTTTTTAGGDLGVPNPGVNEDVLTTATFSLIMLAMGGIGGVLTLLLIVDRFRRS